MFHLSWCVLLSIQVIITISITKITLKSLTCVNNYVVNTCYIIKEFMIVNKLTSMQLSLVQSMKYGDFADMFDSHACEVVFSFSYLISYLILSYHNN